MNPLLLLVLFALFTLLGYKIIGNVPRLLHTPLMSGMSAMSGIVVTGALTATALAVGTGSQILGAIAIAMAMINMVGGFLVTHRMLKMFQAKKKDS